MNKTNKTTLIIAFTIAVVLFIFFSGWAMTGTMMSGSMMGRGMTGGISWMGIPTLLSLGIGILIGMDIFGKK